MSDTTVETDAVPTLRDVLTLRDRALMRIATCSPAPLSQDEDARAALEAVRSLTELARRGLATIIHSGDVVWSIRNDPYCSAAYHLGLEKGRALAQETPAGA